MKRKSYSEVFREIYKAFNTDKMHTLHTCMHKHTLTRRGKETGGFVSWPEMLNVIEIFFLKDNTCHNVHHWHFRYMKHIFFMYRCNFLLGFVGEMNDILSVSLVNNGEPLWRKCQNKALQMNNISAWTNTALKVLIKCLK